MEKTSSYVISKEFEFDYGHRVHTQKLDGEFSLDTQCACRHLHGHRGKIAVHLKALTLNPEGMVTDFKHLNWFKKFIDEVFDHKMILDINDPLLEHLLCNFNWEEVKRSIESIHPQCWRVGVNSEKYKSHSDIEFLEGLVFVDFVPTSENFTKFFFDLVSRKMANMEGVEVCKIEFNETPKSKSVYEKI